MQHLVLYSAHRIESSWTPPAPNGLLRLQESLSHRIAPIFPVGVCWQAQAPRVIYHLDLPTAKTHHEVALPGGFSTARAGIHWPGTPRVWACSRKGVGGVSDGHQDRPRASPLCRTTHRQNRRLASLARVASRRRARLRSVTSTHLLVGWDAT